MKTNGITASDALSAELRGLCLKEYPFGTGSWKISATEPFASRMYSSTTIDYGSEKDHIETLSELVKNKKSPWFSDVSWSEELPLLRQIAITDPDKLTPGYLKKTFKTLRLIDKNVTKIDENVLELKNLEELSLSANYLTSIDSEFLPSKLKVLELNANSIADIESLVKKPPPLQHLGLARNLIENLSSHISVKYWPNLMSLDLSENNLRDLMTLIENLRSLPKLRNLLLCGNPVSLMPSYRGYTIDSLGGLTSLDDVIITADEKHDFKGMNKRAELLKNEARITLKIPLVRGIPSSADADEAEKNGQEYPVIERKYFVRFPFISNVEKKLIKSADLVSEPHEKDTAGKKGPKGKVKSPVQKSHEELEIERLERERLAEKERIRINGPPLIVPFSTCMLEYDADQLSFEHEEQYRVAALLQLKQLFKSGIKFEVVEEKTLYYPHGQTPEELAAERASSGKRSQQRSRKASRTEQGPIDFMKERRKSSILADRGTTPNKAAHTPKAAAKKGSPGQTGNLFGDLVKYSTTQKTIGSAVFELRALLTSTDQCRLKAALHAGGGPMRPEDMELLETPPATAASDLKKDKKDKKKAVVKPTGGKDKKKGGVTGAEEEGELLAPPIVILVELEVRRWTKTKHFVKEHDYWTSFTQHTSSSSTAVV